MGLPPAPLDEVRYEILPFGSAEAEAEQAARSRPVTLTVTCSPRQGIDHGVEVACRLRGLGHAVIAHIAARTVRGPEHLDELMGRMAVAGVADVFLVGGDESTPHGPYDSALALLPAMRTHRNAPRTIGVAAYPEGHPLITDGALLDALRGKEPLADYMVTQLCFDADSVLGWLRRTRAAGVGLPVYIGLPGVVDRRRLLEISMRVGVGASLSYIRKQRGGMRRLLGRHQDAVGRLHARIAPLVGHELGVAGLHFFTFNHLLQTICLAEEDMTIDQESLSK